MLSDTVEGDGREKEPEIKSKRQMLSVQETWKYKKINLIEGNNYENEPRPRSIHGKDMG